MPADNLPPEDEATEERLDATKPERTAALNRSRLPFKCLGDFSIESEIGRGGMGVVYHATERRLDRKVALKVLPNSEDGNRVIEERFILEARAAAKLNHDHVVPVYHIGEDKGVRFFAMKLIDGSNLSRVVKSAKVVLKQRTSSSRKPQISPSGSTVKDNHASSSSGLDLSGEAIASGQSNDSLKAAINLSKAVARLGMHVADALHHAHQHGVIHRDIKPSNLLLDRDQKVWVSDFGLAQLQGAPSLTRTGQVVGTLHYMSPEQASGRRAFVDHRTDIYSLGVTLYELATLQRACQGRTTRDILREITFERPTPVRKLNPRLPKDFETIICKATERNPADRYQTAEELAKDLVKFVEGKSIATKRIGKLKRAQNWFVERPAATALTICGSVFGVVVLSLLLFGSIKRQQALNDALTYSRQQFMLADAMLELPQNPGKAIAISLEALRSNRSVEGQRVLLSALDRNHERLTIRTDYPGSTICNPLSNQILLLPHNKFFNFNWKAKLYDSQSGKEILTLDSGATVTMGGFSFDGRLLLTAGTSYGPMGDNSFSDSEFTPPKLWKVSSGNNFNTCTELQEFSAAKLLELTSANFSSDGKYLVVPGSNNTAEIHQTNGGIAAKLIGHEQPVVRCAIDPRGRFAATWSMDGSASIFDFETGQLVSKTLVTNIKQEDIEISFSQNGNWLLCEGNGYAHLIECGNNNPRVIKKVCHDATFVGRDSALAILAWDRKRTRLFLPKLDLVISECISEEPLLGIEAKGDHLQVIATQMNSVCLFDFLHETKVAEFAGHSDSIISMDSPTGMRASITSAWDSTIRLWEPISNLEQRTLLNDLPVTTTPVVTYSANGDRIAVGSFRRSNTTAITLDNVNVKSSINGEVCAVLTNGNIVVCQGNSVECRESETMRLLNKIELKYKVTDAVLTSKDDNCVFVKTVNGDVYGWDVEEEVPIQLNEKGQNLFLQTEPHETIPILRGYDRVHAVDTSDWSKKELFHLEANSIAACAVSPDGRSMAIANNRNSVSVWNIEEQNKKSEFTSETDVLRLSFVFDGKAILILPRSAKDTTQLWQLGGEENSLLEFDFGYVRDYDLHHTLDECLIASSKGLFRLEADSSQTTQLDESPMAAAKYAGNGIAACSSPYDGSTSNTPTTEFFFLEGQDSETVTWKSRLNHSVTNLEIDTPNNLYYASGLAKAAAVVSTADQDIVGHSGSHDHDLIYAAFGDGDKHLISVSKSGQILARNLTSKKEERLVSLNGRAVAACISGDKQFVIASDESGGLADYSLKTNLLANTYEHTKEPVEQIVASDTGGLFVTRHSRSDVLVWDARQNAQKPIRTLEFEHGVKQIALSSSSNSLLTINGRKYTSVASTRLFETEPELSDSEPDAEIWSLSEEAKVIALTIEQDAILGRFYDDGKVVALLSRDGLIHVFEAASGVLVRTIESEKPILALPICDESSKIIYGADTDAVYGWTPRSGKKQLHIANVVDELNVKANLSKWKICADDEGDIFLPSKNSIVRIPRSLVAYANSRKPRELTVSERQKYFQTAEEL